MIRACQLIGELENNKRGIYGGAIGYIDFTGNMDTCIAIRIAYKKNGKVFVRSGAGIVADSVPEKEYEECINKARSILSQKETTILNVTHRFHESILRQYDCILTMHQGKIVEMGTFEELMKKKQFFYSLYTVNH